MNFLISLVLIDFQTNFFVNSRIVLVYKAS